MISATENPKVCWSDKRHSDSSTYGKDLACVSTNATLSHVCITRNPQRKNTEFDHASNGQKVAVEINVIDNFSNQGKNKPAILGRYTVSSMHLEH